MNPTMMDTYQIAQANNRACSLVERGQYRAAIATFTQLLASSKKLMDVFSDREHLDCRRDPPTTSLDACMIASSSSLPSSVEPMGSDGNSTRRAFIYQHAIRLPASSAFTLTYGNGVLISAIIMFNLGLCHHLRAYAEMHNMDDAMLYLKKAGKLYELSYNLHLEENLDCIEGQNVYFTMTTINNLGMVHNALGRHETAQLCFQHLLSAVVFLVDQKEGYKNNNTMDGFIRNTSFLIIRDNTAAAA